MALKPIRDALRRGLGSHRVPVVLAGLAVLLMLPALWAGWLPDDLVQRAHILPETASPRLQGLTALPERSGELPFVLARLFSHTDRVPQQMDSGVLPWWTAPGIRVRFLRPFAAFTHFIDYHLFGARAWPMHLHSIAWFAAGIGLLALLYRRLLQPAWVAGLAALLFCLDESYYMPVMFVANRCIVICFVFGVAALLAHHEWRTTGLRTWALLSVALLALSLLSSEAGVAVVGYVLAYALVMERGSWKSRAAGIVPSVVLVLVWRLAYGAGGYGAAQSGFYIDPLGDPVRFAHTAARWGPVLMLGQWGVPAAEMFHVLGAQARSVVWAAAAGYTALLALIGLPLILRERVARFWALGMLLALAPLCATSPWNRNLFFVGVGAMGLVAQFAGGLFARAEWLPRTRLWRAPAWALCAVLLVIHVGIAGTSRVTAPALTAWAVRTFNDTVDFEASPEVARQDLVVVSAPNPFMFHFMPYLREDAGGGLPRSARVLAPGFRALEVRRTGEREIAIRAVDEDLMTPGDRPGVPMHLMHMTAHFNELWRDRSVAFAPGRAVSLEGLDIEVVGVAENGQPTDIRYSFAVPLEDAGLRWIAWDWSTERLLGGFVPFQVPAVGESATIAGPY
jgi:hypothetical protein